MRLIFALVLCISLILIGSPMRASAGTDSVSVRFSIKWEKPAGKISLAGNFNNFDLNADLLQGPDSAGVWQIEKKLPYGTYEYRFVIDDRIYVRDPANPDFGGIRSNSLLYLDPPQKPHLKVISPLPGQRIIRFPLEIRIRFELGSRTEKIDLKKSRILIDEKPVEMKYDRKNHLLEAEIKSLPEGEHAFAAALTDSKKNRTRQYRSIFVVNAQNEAPVAEAGYSQFCRPGEPVHLDGGLSYDPDLDDLAIFQWKVLGDTVAVQITGDADTAFPQAVFRKTGDYRFVLRVSDGALWSVPDTTTVYCRKFPASFADFRLKTEDATEYAPLQTVSVAGEFNRWQAGADTLGNSGSSVWELCKPLRPGQYEYKFVLNNQHWIPDPANDERVEDGWKGFNSVLTVPPLFAEPLDWNFRLLSDGLILQNSANQPFTVLEDNNNPAELNWRGDSLLTSGMRPGTYFSYALAGPDSRPFPPQLYLFQSNGNHALSLMDFRETPGWTRNAVTYQIYLRAFGPDSTRQGTLRDLRSKLDYLQELGVNCVWLMPIMESPTEHGYTPVDYFSIEKDYGTLAEFDSLISDLHRRGMKFFFDFVANHSSDQHPYFLSAWYNPQSVFRNWYIWHGPREYEFHNDWDQLPNLNYNNPNVRHFILKAAKFWIDHGVDGLRCDAAWGVPHDFWKDFRRKIKSWNPEVALLDEVLPRDPAYHDFEFDMSYDTDFYGNVLDVFRGRKSVEGLRFGLEKTAANYPPQVVDFRYIENQDMPRFISQFGPRAAKAAAALLYTLPGMPLVYYGQEVGLRETREPMRWNLVGNPMFQFYRELIGLRKSHPAFSGSSVKFMEVSAPGKVLAYSRESGAERFAVVINFASSPLDMQVQGGDERKFYYIFGSEKMGPGIHLVDIRNLHLDAYGFVILKMQ
ncbi:MAG: alpha-amylase family glycosyl hydrolase [Calditrichia bacterium]